MMFSRLGHIQKIGLFYSYKSINNFGSKSKRSFMQYCNNLFLNKKKLRETFEFKHVNAQPQTCLLHIRQMSNFSSSSNSNTRGKFTWRYIQVKLLRPRFLFFGVVIIAVLLYPEDKLSEQFKKVRSIFQAQTVDQNTFDKHKQSFELKDEHAAAYAFQGRRHHMEDRFVINHNVNGTGVSVYAVFDGHGGEFVSNFAEAHLVHNLGNKIVELKNLLVDKDSNKKLQPFNINAENPYVLDLGNKNLVRHFEKTAPTDTNNNIIIEEQQVDLSTYITGDKINYEKLLKDEILALDKTIIDIARQNKAYVGSTALLALIDDNNLFVANVGDSRGVMCDGQGNVIPLSYDHKPNDEKERTRIENNGGYVIKTSVWRVGRKGSRGRLALSRALGDYSLKENDVVIAEPDVLTFNLEEHNAAFFVLATDGLWDEYTNKETVDFLKKHIREPDFGAKSLTMACYNKGSRDNITVLVVNLKKPTKRFFWS